jgi:hypothetical protein
MTTIDAPDPLAKTENGEDDPIGPFDPDNICGAEAKTGVNSWNTAKCVREPHPAHWLHISACDDRVDFVWRPGTWLDLGQVVVTDDEGVVCRECALPVNAHGSHYAGCSLSPRTDS